MKKRLVFHWFIPRIITEDVEKYFNLHLNCLKHYADVFDECDIIIAKDIDASENVARVRNNLIETGLKNIHFYEKDNDDSREVNTFVHFCILRLPKQRDEITFFFHNKGLTHKFEQTIIDWNCALYFFNLENVDVIIDAICHNNKKMVSGILLTENDRFGCKYHWVYSGTALWMNNDKIAEYISTNNIVLGPKELHSAEEFFGNICDMSYAHSIGDVFVDSWGDYRDCLNYHIRAIMSEYYVNKFISFRDNIALKNITIE